MERLLFSSIINCSWDLLRDHVLKHLCFLVQVGDNVKSLDDMAMILEAKRKDVIEKIQADERLGNKPTHEVEEWLKKTQVVQQNAQSIRGDYDRRNCIFPGTSTCSFNCFSNYYIGSRVAEELSNVKMGLKNYADFKEITTEVLPPPAQEMPATTLTEAGGYEIGQKLQMALDFLTDDAQSALGLWGMGGVGKTTLLEHINNSLAKDPSAFGFHHVIFLMASRDCTVGKVQELLRKKLGLNSTEQIFVYLSNKSFVLLLDDLWDRLDLKQAGIPLPFGTFGEYKRKLILTTRSQQVCYNMDVHNIIQVKCLSPEAARRLFRKNVGEDTIFSHPLIPQLADKVANECDGLPLALITTGRAMAGNKTVQVWEHAIKLFRDSKPSKIQGMYEDPLQLLKFSYDHLKDATVQLCFLHCALWPEDHEIRKEGLIECWMGHGLLEGDFDEIHEVYNQGYAIIDGLQKACLLECVERDEWRFKNQCVKLHDVIRDMALWIARDCGKNEKKWIVLEGEGVTKLTWETRAWSEVDKMSVWRSKINGFPSEIESCPKLNTLILNSNTTLASNGMEAVKHFFQLKYLDLTECSLLGDFPIEICSLIKLEYLNISYTEVSSLPKLLKNLTNLKYLLARETGISRLPDDLIANLVSLLYLNLFTARYNLSQSSIIDDLNCGEGRLKAIGINVSTDSDIKKLVQLNISIRDLSIQRMEGIASLRSGDVVGSKHMHLNMRHLNFRNCGIKELVVDEEHRLSNLDYLRLYELPGLKEVIWKGVEPQHVLPNLRNVTIRGCPELKHVTWIVNLPCLEYLYLRDCKNMKHLIWEEAVKKIAEPYSLGFPNLRDLKLWDLPSLNSICHRVLAFPSLEYLYVRRCEQLRKLSFQSPPALSKLKKIEGGTEWWNNLEMDDDTRNFLRPFHVKP